MQRNHQPRFPKNGRSAYSTIRLIPHFIFIGLLIAAYYYIWRNNLFFNHINEIYLAITVLIAIDIFIASINSALAPILALTAGASLLYFEQNYAFSFHSIGWQLLMMSGVGFIIRFLVR